MSKPKIKEIEEVLLNNTIRNILAVTSNENKILKYADEKEWVEKVNGGAYVSNDPEALFYHFISNSEIKTVVTSSLFGITFKAILKKDTDDNLSYYYVERDEDNKLVKKKLTSLCLKIGLSVKDKEQTIKQIQEGKTELAKELSYILEEPNGEEIHKEKLDDKEFINEAIAQNSIYQNTNYALDPICPAVVFSRIFYDLEEGKKFFRYINQYCDGYSRKILLKLLHFVKEDVFISIHAMEFIDCSNYEEYKMWNPTIHTKITERHYTEICYTIIKMIIFGKIFNKDMNFNNIIYCITKQKFYIIDYGIIYYIPDDIYIKCYNHYIEGDYFSILEKFTNIKMLKEQEIRCDTSRLINLFIDTIKLSLPETSFFDDINYRTKLLINQKISEIHKKYQEKYGKYDKYREYILNLNKKYIYLMCVNYPNNEITDTKLSIENKDLKPLNYIMNNNTIFNPLEFEKLDDIKDKNVEEITTKIYNKQLTINNITLNSLIEKENKYPIPKEFYHYLISLFMINLLIYVNNKYGGKHNKTRKTRGKRNKTKRKTRRNV
jgi:hypothetical protein